MFDKNNNIEMFHCNKYSKLLIIIITFEIISIFKAQIIDYISDEEKIKKCGYLNPKNEFECFLYSTNDSLCCYLSLTNEIADLYNNTLKNRFCLSLEKDKYNKLGNINFMNINYRINCGIGTQIFSSSQASQAGAKCGIFRPQKPSDCFSNKIVDDHCCYYKINNISGCYLLGDKFSGVYKDDENQIYYECAGHFIRIKESFKNYVLFIMIVMLIL